MSEKTPHARTFDIPGWPCPPRVRDIPNMEESWGYIMVSPFFIAVGQDELGYLWLLGSTVPEFRVPPPGDGNPGGVVYWTEDGAGLWIHPKSLRHLPSISRLDMKPNEWLPVAHVTSDLPPFIKDVA